MIKWKSVVKDAQGRSIPVVRSQEDMADLITKVSQKIQEEQMKPSATWMVAGAKTTDLLESGYVWAPHMPLYVSPVITRQAESLAAADLRKPTVKSTAGAPGHRSATPRAGSAGKPSKMSPPDRPTRFV